MSRTVALYAGACLACFLAAGSAKADAVTYTFDTISSSNGSSLNLTFTVDGAVSFDANDTAYSFPSALTSFAISYDGDSATLADFTSPNQGGSGTGAPGFPQWTLDLTADPTNDTASLGLFFVDANDSFSFYGPNQGSAAQLSTAADGTINFAADGLPEAVSFNGILTTNPTPTPEPTSLVLLLSGLAVFGIIGVRRGYCAVG